MSFNPRDAESLRLIAKSDQELARLYSMTLERGQDLIDWLINHWGLTVSNLATGLELSVAAVEAVRRGQSPLTVGNLEALSRWLRIPSAMIFYRWRISTHGDQVEDPEISGFLLTLRRVIEKFCGRDLPRISARIKALESRSRHPSVGTDDA